jgi:hypothetical protein
MITKNFSGVFGLFQNNNDYYNPTKCPVPLFENCFTGMCWVVTVGSAEKKEDLCSQTVK